jgi:hypothetical protein
MPNPAVKHALEKPESVKKVILTKSYDIAGRKRVFVIPSTVHLGGENPPEAIEWVNETGGTVWIWLPTVDHYLSLHPHKDKGENVVKPIRVLDGEISRPFVVKDRKDLTQAEFYYHYDVYCESIHDYAQGDSDPGVGYP